jgi:hypothetical protein
VEPPGGESGNTENTWGTYNKPAGCSTPAYGAPHKQTNKTVRYVLKFEPQLKCFHKIYKNAKISNLIFLELLKSNMLHVEANRSNIAAFLCRRAKM